MAAAPLANDRDRIFASTRIVSAFIIPFLVVAFVVLFPWPTDTKRLFAWPIKPTVSAMILGSVYLGGAYFFFRVVRSSKWHTVAGGFVPIGTFASLMGITTILHWNRFVHSHVAFWLWVGLYFTTPFIIFTVFVRNQRQYDRSTDGELKIGPTAAVALVVSGVLAVLMCAFLYVLPSQASRIWPWTLSPLTARVLGAIFALGLAGLGAARERRRRAARLLIQVEGFMLVLILVAAARAHDEFDSGNALTWLFAAGFGVTVLASAVFYVRMERIRVGSSSAG
jgi:hypothetical protein